MEDENKIHMILLLTACSRNSR